MGSTAPELPKSLAESSANSKAEYKRLGKSGLRVSVPILGAMSIGHKDWADWVIEEDQALPLLKAAYDRGLNTWDTANVYSNGISEQLIAKAIKKYSIPRHKVVILSKCYGHVGEEPNVVSMRYRDVIISSKDYVNQGGLSRAAIFNAVNASLARLETDYMDLLQIHRFDADTPIEETMEALHDLVKMGKVRYIGASSMWAYQLAMMQACADKHGWTKFISMQNQHSLLYREEEREMNKYCLETGVGLIPWAPLYRGYLARPLSATGTTERSKGEQNAAQPSGLSDTDKTIIGRVEEMADKKRWKMSQVAMAWSIQKGNIPIIGFSKVERIDEALEVKGKTLTEEEMKYLEEPYQPKNIMGHS